MAKAPLIIALTLLGAAMFLVQLGERDIVTSHEARVAQTAREMARTGWPWNAEKVEIPAVRLVDTPEGKRLRAVPGAQPVQVNAWGVPRINGEVRLQKPPLPYWGTAVLYRLFGVSEWTARLIPALLGLLCVPLLWDLGRRTAGHSGGAIAAVIWISTYFVVDEFRKAMADPYLAFFTLACLWAWVRSCEVGQTAGRWVVLFYAMCGAGLMAKGPPLLFHVPVAVAAYSACFGRMPQGGWRSHLLGLGALLLIATPWPLYIVFSVPAAMDLWQYESIGGLTGENTEKGRGVLFYIPQLVMLSLPWVALWVAAIAHPWIRVRTGWNHGRRAMFPLLWASATIVLFSLMKFKKAAYLLPIMPAHALLLAQALTALAASQRRPRHAVEWGKHIQRVQGIISVGLGIVTGAALALNICDWPLDTPFMPALGQVVKEGVGRVSAPSLLLGVLAIIIGAVPLMLQRTGLRRWFVVQGAAYSVLLLLFLVRVDAPFENARSPKAFAAQVWEVMRARPDCTLSRARMQEAALFYLADPPAYDASARCVLVAVELRRKRGGQALDKQWFAPDVPDGKVLDVTHIALPVQSDRNGWRLYELKVDR